MKAINVLSLFGGGETGYYALTQAGIKINKYFSAEIEPNCIAVSTYLYPSIIHIGDVKYVRYANGRLFFSSEDNQCFAFETVKIDLVIGGSPCTTVSMAGKMEGLEGSSDYDLISRWIVGDVPKHFIVSAKEATFASTPLHLFTLDEEDLKYLYNKYSKAKEEVLKHSMEEYKNKYKDV